MHELSVAEDLWRLVEAERAARGAAHLRGLRVAIGELSGVDPALLSLAWEALAGAQVELEIQWCPARQACGGCGEVSERQAGSWLRLCPRCGDPLRVEGGDELDLLELSFAGETEAQPC